MMLEDKSKIQAKIVEWSVYSRNWKKLRIATYTDRWIPSKSMLLVTVMSYSFSVSRSYVMDSLLSCCQQMLPKGATKMVV